MKTQFFEAQSARLLFELYEKWLKERPSVKIVTTAGFIYNSTSSETKQVSFIVTYQE